ncbi:MAG: multidrug effflux MFS transporter [Desulfacinum sp.]|nr:multidrug effflux MFS transporter [Desulfacinum sp.]
MKRWILFLGLLAAFPPLATDMYLPAIPSLVRLWQEPLWIVNLTLTLFFVVYSFFLLIYGPLSDRFGRRPLLKMGIGLYVFASILCALSPNIWVLIVCRTLQAAGAAAASSLSLAISKDIFEPRQREKLLAYIGVVIALAPMVAPIIGGWTLVFLSWRWIFVQLACVGVVALIGIYSAPETLQVPSHASTKWLFRDYLELVHNLRFMQAGFISSLSSIPLFAFIAASSDIYITDFGLSEQAFGLFFGFNAIALMMGAFACPRLNRRLPPSTLLRAGFSGIALAGAWLMLGKQTQPWGLALPMFALSFCAGLLRPPITNLALEQVERGAGSASSFLMFAIMTSGAASMWFISLDWSDKIRTLGTLSTVSALSGLLCWHFLQSNLACSPQVRLTRVERKG